MLMQIDLRRLFEHAHRLRVRRGAWRSEVPRIEINIPDLFATFSLTIARAPTRR
jgi:hypothetical protein